MRPGWFDMQRRVVATKTTEAWQQVPHVGFVYEPDATDVLAWFRDHRNVPGGRLTLNTVLLKIVTEGLVAAPRLNAHVRYHAGKSEGRLTPLPEVNIALPWMTRGGTMITPTVFGCNAMSLVDLQQAITTLRTRVDNTHVEELLLETTRAEAWNRVRRLDVRYLPKVLASTVTLHPITALKGDQRRAYYAQEPHERLTPHDLLGATVSVSNIGSILPGISGHFSMLQIIEPQVFVVGLNPPRTHLQDGVPRTVLPMTLVFDHRALDFSHLVPFITRCEEIFTHPRELSDWLPGERAAYCPASTARRMLRTS